MGDGARHCYLDNFGHRVPLTAQLTISSVIWETDVGVINLSMPGPMGPPRFGAASDNPADLGKCGILSAQCGNGRLFT